MLFGVLNATVDCSRYSAKMLILTECLSKHYRWCNLFLQPRSRIPSSSKISILKSSITLFASKVPPSHRRLSSDRSIRLRDLSSSSASTIIKKSWRTCFSERRRCWDYFIPPWALGIGPYPQLIWSTCTFSFASCYPRSRKLQRNYYIGLREQSLWCTWDTFLQTLSLRQLEIRVVIWFFCCHNDK